VTRPDSSNILLGRAEIRIDRSVDHIGTTTPALTSDHSLGQAQDCSMQNIREFEVIRKLNSPMPIDRYLTDFGVGLTATILNANIEIFALLFGYNPNTISDEIKFSPKNFTKTNMIKWRVEAEFVYPDKKNKMTVIIPKASLINPSSPSLINLDSPENVGFEFDGEEVDNTTWIGAELGKIVFGTI